MILVIDRRAAVVRYQAGTLIVEAGGMAPQRVPLKVLERVVVFGNPLVEARVWRVLAENAIPAAVLPGRGCGETAVLGQGLAVQLPLRKRQYQLAFDPRRRQEVARWFIDAKLRSYDLPIHEWLAHQPGTEADIQAFVCWRNRALGRLETADTLGSLMGREGGIARAWFALAARHLDKKWRFSRRNRRPPRDPANALLSLGYTLLYADVRQTLAACGFDPALGFLHQQYPAREALVLDFVEIFRSGVDLLVFELLSKAPFGKDSFYYREKEGCRLSKQGRPLFFKAWARWLEHWPRPLGGPDRGEWPKAPLSEQIAGQVARFRRSFDKPNMEENHAPQTPAD